MTETLELLSRGAAVRPSSLSEDGLEFEAIVTTFAPVQRRDASGPYEERLNPDAIDPADLIGLPLLDNHQAASVRHTIGRVISARRDGGNLIARMRLSEAEDVRPIAQRLADRTLFTFSIGYSVQEWRTVLREATSTVPRTRIKIADQWKILEISTVSTPADPGATLRSNAMNEETTTTTAPPAPESEATQTRAAAIRTIQRSAGLSPEWADEQIDSGADVIAARAAANEEMVKRTAPVIRTQRAPDADQAAVFNRAAEGLAARMGGAAPSDEARPFANMGLIDHARSALQAAGVPGINAMSREEVLHRAMHTTSDFPALLTASGNRVLMPAYQAAMSPIKRLARQVTAPDFRPRTTIKVGEMGRLEKVAESGEITSTTTGEAVESYRLETFARMFSLSRQAIINDDLAAFGRWNSMMGQAAAETEANELIDLLTENSGTGPVMTETGQRLFSAAHGNLAGTAGAPSVETLTAARKAMRNQKGLSGDYPINVTPRYLLVAPDLETQAEKLLAELRANTVDEQNPFSGRLELMVEARLPETAWYVFADPASVPVLEYAYLSSAQGPQLSSRDGWEVLGREFRVTLDFGCGAVDYRGAFRNAGE